MSVDRPASKPYSPAAERNRDPILAVLRRHFADRRHVLEIGSGSGQHAVHFAHAMPWLTWQPSDRHEQLAGIGIWRDEASLPNLAVPLPLDVKHEPDWNRLGDVCAVAGAFDAIYTSNTLHIMSWPEVGRMFARLPTLMTAHALLAVYGPFKVGGRHTSASNADFDATLRARLPHQGIRDLEAVDALARHAGMVIREDCALPANNRCVVWQRVDRGASAF